jgi:hypothetical protein
VDFADVSRLLNDPYNALFEALQECGDARISLVIFNKVIKAANLGYAHLSFTPNADSLSLMRDVCVVLTRKPACAALLAPHADAFAELAVALPFLPDGVRHETQLEGVPIVCLGPLSAACEAAQSVVAAVARRLVL